MPFSSLTRGRVFGEDQVGKLDLSRLRPACDPPLKAGFVCLGSRLLANHLEHSAPTRARSQFGHRPSRARAQSLSSLRVEAARIKPFPNERSVFCGREV